MYQKTVIMKKIHGELLKNEDTCYNLHNASKCSRKHAKDPDWESAWKVLFSPKIRVWCYLIYELIN